MDMDIKVSQLVVSRICHDLAGSVSAVNAGIELIKDGASTSGQGALDQEAMSLVDASADQSVRKLSFFRIIFGSGGGADGSISLAELCDLSQNYLDGSKVNLDWPEQASAQTGAQRLGIDAGRVLLGMVLMAAGSLPRGGVISIGVHYPDGGVGFAVVAAGDRASLGPEVEAAMSSDANIDDLTARTVHAHFTDILVKSLGGELEYSREAPGEGICEVRLAAIIPT